MVTGTQWQLDGLRHFRHYVTLSLDSPHAPCRNRSWKQGTVFEIPNPTTIEVPRVTSFYRTNKTLKRIEDKYIHKYILYYHLEYNSLYTEHLFRNLYQTFSISYHVTPLFFVLGKNKILYNIVIFGYIRHKIADKTSLYINFILWKKHIFLKRKHI